MAASMKLSIDRKSKRVVYAEAGKDCVDFLFQILSLPAATIVSLLGARGMPQGSLPKLYQSLENLHNEYIQPNMDKYTFLDPLPTCSIPLLGIEVPSTQETSYNICGNYVYHEPPNYSCGFGRPRVVEDAAEDEGGLVKGEVSYMVTDDLEVKPMSTISIIALLGKFNVKEVGDLEEKVVHLGMNEV